MHAASPSAADGNELMPQNKSSEDCEAATETSYRHSSGAQAPIKLRMASTDTRTCSSRPGRLLVTLDALIVVPTPRLLPQR